MSQTQIGNNKLFTIYCNQLIRICRIPSVCKIVKESWEVQGKVPNRLQNSLSSSLTRKWVPVKMSKWTQEDRSAHNISSMSLGSVQLDSFPWLLSQSTELGTSPHEHWDWLEDSVAESAFIAKHQESPPEKVNLLWSLEKGWGSGLGKAPSVTGLGRLSMQGVTLSLPIRLHVVLISYILLHSLPCLAVLLNSDPCGTTAFDMAFLNQ